MLALRARLARLLNIFTPPTTPSALLVIGKFGDTINILHLVPETGSIERFKLSTSATTFRQYGATEQAREQIGAVTLHVGDGETTGKFLDDVETRIRKLRNDSLGSSSGVQQLQIGSTEVNQLVQDVLQPAALDAIHERNGRDRSKNATQEYSVYVVYINRSRAGKILNDDQFTSFPH